MQFEKQVKPTQNTIFVIRPERRDNEKQKSISSIGKNFNVIYFASQEESMINTLIFGKITHL